MVGAAFEVAFWFWFCWSRKKLRFKPSISFPGFYMRFDSKARKPVGINNSYKLLYQIGFDYISYLLGNSFFNFFIFHPFYMEHSKEARGKKPKYYKRNFDNMNFRESSFFCCLQNLFLFLQDVCYVSRIRYSLRTFIFLHQNFAWKQVNHFIEFLFIPQAWTIGVEIFVLF